MSGRSITTKAELMTHIERSWAALNTSLKRLTAEQMTVLRDSEGWSVKDHLVHLAAWERSVIFFLQGKPRHEGLGVEEALYLQGKDDDINAVIYQQCRDLPMENVLARLHDAHRQLMQLLQTLSDSDLLQPYRRYLPEEPGQGDGPPAINVIYGNTANHFAEHLSWIEALVNKAGAR